MSTSYKLNRTCPICGKRIIDSSKTGYCNIHRPRTGKNNPFYGKHHSKETIEKSKEKLSEISKKLWQDPEYRKKVIEGATGKKRSDSFKKTQRKNALKQMEDPKQRQLRSNIMKKSWETHKIEWHVHRIPNFSKQEIQFGSMLKEALGIKGNLLRDNLKLERIDLKGHYYIPDFVFNNFIIEYDGDFWHAIGREDNEIVHNNITAKEIRDNDTKKDNTYMYYGYNIIRIASSSFKKNPNLIISQVVEILLGNKNELLTCQRITL